MVPLILLVCALVTWAAPTRCSSGEPVPLCALGAQKASHFYEPDHYELTLEPDFEQRQLSGYTEISLHFTGEPMGQPAGGASQSAASGTLARGAKSLGAKIGKVCKSLLGCGLASLAGLVEAPTRLALNLAPALELDGLRLTSLDGAGERDKSPIEVESMCRDLGNQMLLIELSRRPARGARLKLELSFSGLLVGHPEAKPAPVALELSEHKLELLTSGDLFGGQARALFPSLDQPDMRATLGLSLIHDARLESIASLPKVSKQQLPTGDKVKVRFATSSKPLASFSLAFAIAPGFQTSECRVERGSGRPLVVVHLPQGKQLEQAQFILSFVCDAIPLFERHIKRPFPLERLHLSVSASRRPAGAARVSHTAGLLLFDEELLLFGQHHLDSPDDRQAEALRQAGRALVGQWLGAG